MATADRPLPPQNAVAAEFTLRKEIADARTEVAPPQTGCAAGRQPPRRSTCQENTVTYLASVAHIQKSKAALLIAVFVLCSSLASWAQMAQANEPTQPAALSSSRTQS